MTANRGLRTWSTTYAAHCGGGGGRIELVGRVCLLEERAEPGHVRVEGPVDGRLNCWVVGSVVTTAYQGVGAATAVVDSGLG